MKKILSISLVWAMITIFFISCSNDSSSIDNPQITETEYATETETAETTNYTADYLPDVKYGGYEFRMITTIDDLCVSDVTEMDGEVLNDALYTRNRKIESDYNIKLTQIQANSWTENPAILSKSVLSGSDDFDLIRMVMRDAFASSLSGYVAPVRLLPYCDTTRDWYIKYINDELTMGDTLYFAYSEECLGTYMYTSCIYFNKDILENLGLDSPYAYVNNGNWTMDTFFKLADQSMRDINGDNIYTVTDDQLACIGLYDFYVSGFWVCGEQKAVLKDENNLPYFNITDRMYTMLSELYNHWYTDGMFFDPYYEKGGGFAEGCTQAIEYFSGAHSLFLLDNISTSSNLRDMEDDFGLIPYPKYSESQERYYSNTIDGYVNLVPSHAFDLERTSVILEALAVESKNFVTPAYIEKAVGSKALRDTESLEMLNIILQNRTIDLGVTIWLSPIRLSIVDNCFAKGENSFASSVAKNETKINKAIAETIEIITAQ